ncbi:MAG TPA: tetratricopeptide repeat protein [Kofleriaceae bacterium]|nr:tetratricopeptide repeat protein [Kofleriaceae bacterium]
MKVHVLIGMLVIGAAAPARAGGKCSKAATRMAYEQFDEGEKAYTLGKWDEAIGFFEAAYEACPNQWYLYGLAQAYRKKDDCHSAIDFYGRYLARAAEENKDRQLEVEDNVRNTFLPELEAKCRDTTVTPPDGPLAPPPKPRQPPVRKVAAASDDAGDDDDDDDDGEDAAIAMPAPRAHLVAADVEAGAAFLTGLGPSIRVPVQMGVRAGAGYPLHIGRLDLVPGALVTYAPVPWNADADGDGTVTSGSSALIGLLANVHASYPLLPRLALRAEAGAGVQLFSGLGADNPFTDPPGAAATGALPTLDVRLAVGAECAVTRNLVITASLPSLSYSPRPAGLRPDISSLTRVEILFGAGYRM